MGGGILSGLVWGTMTSVIVLGVVSQMAPLPPSALEQVAAVPPAPADLAQASPQSATPSDALPPLGGAEVGPFALAEPEEAKPTEPVISVHTESDVRPLPEGMSGVLPKRATQPDAAAQGPRIKAGADIPVTAPATAEAQVTQDVAAATPGARPSPETPSSVLASNAATTDPTAAAPATAEDTPFALAEPVEPPQSPRVNANVVTEPSARPETSPTDDLAGLTAETVAGADTARALAPGTGDAARAARTTPAGAPSAQTDMVAERATPSEAAAADPVAVASNALGAKQKSLVAEEVPGVAPDRVAATEGSGVAPSSDPQRVSSEAEPVLAMAPQIGDQSALASTDPTRVRSATTNEAVLGATRTSDPSQANTAVVTDTPQATSAVAQAPAQTSSERPAAATSDTAQAVGISPSPQIPSTAEAPSTAQAAAAQTASTAPSTQAPVQPAGTQPVASTVAATDAAAPTIALSDVAASDSPVAVATAPIADVAPDGSAAEQVAVQTAALAESDRSVALPMAEPSAERAPLGRVVARARAERPLVAITQRPSSELNSASESETVNLLVASERTSPSQSATHSAQAPVIFGALPSDPSRAVLGAVAEGGLDRPGELSSRTAITPNRPAVPALTQARAEVEVPTATELPDETDVELGAVAAAPASDTAPDAPADENVQLAQAQSQLPQVRRNGTLGVNARVVPLTERTDAAGRPGRLRIGSSGLGRETPAEETPVAEATAPATPDENAPALERNAVAFENPEARPKFSIVLIDAGAQGIDQATLKDLTIPVTIALDPSQADAGARAASYRDAGFEVVLLAAGLPERAQPRDIEVAYATWIADVPQAVAVIDTQSGDLAKSRVATSQMSQALKGEGHGLVFYDKGLNSAASVAQGAGVRTGLAFRQLDARDERAPVIGRYLDRAAFKAAQEGHVIVVGHTYDETVRALLTWALEGRGKTVALAPISAVLRED